MAAAAPPPNMPSAEAYVSNLKRGFSAAAQLEAALQQNEEKEKKTGRKALLPGFEGHRDRCMCLLCKKRRKDSEELIKATKQARAMISSAAASGAGGSLPLGTL